MEFAIRVSLPLWTLRCLIEIFARICGANVQYAKVVFVGALWKWQTLEKGFKSYTVKKESDGLGHGAYRASV